MPKPVSRATFKLVTSRASSGLSLGGQQQRHGAFRGPSRCVRFESSQRRFHCAEVVKPRGGELGTCCTLTHPLHFTPLPQDASKSANNLMVGSSVWGLLLCVLTLCVNPSGSPALRPSTRASQFLPTTVAFCHLSAGACQGHQPACQEPAGYEETVGEQSQG